MWDALGHRCRPRVTAHGRLRGARNRNGERTKALVEKELVLPQGLAEQDEPILSIEGLQVRDQN